MTTIPTAAPRGTEKKAMPFSRVRHLALLAAAPLALLGALAFLIVKTQAIDFQRDAQALALLREMKDLDIRWDQDALRLANDFAPREAVTAERGALIARNMQELERGFTSGSLAAE